MVESREPNPRRRSAARVTLGVAAAGTSSFALLYAPQPVLAQLASDFDLSPGGAALAVGVATGALALAVMPLALLSDLVGRVRMLAGSLVASVLIGVVMPLAPDFATLLVLRALQGAAIAGVAGIAAAYLAERVGRTGLAAAVGVMIAGNTVGGMLGRLGAGLGVDRVGWRGGLVVVAVLAALLTVVSLWALRGAPGPRSAPPDEPPWPWRRRLRATATATRNVLRDRTLIAQDIVAFLAMGSFVTLHNAIGFRLLAEPFGLSPGVASLVFLVYAVGAAASLVTGRFVERVGRRGTVLGALGVTAGGVVLTLPAQLPAVVVGFTLITAGFFAAHTAANGWVAADAPEHARAAASGAYTTSYYLGSSVVGTLGSAVYGVAGWPAMTGFVVTALAIAAGTAASLTRRPRR